MNLIIDVGNTRIKIAVFEKSKLIFKKIINLEDFTDTVLYVKSNYPLIKDAILSSVSRKPEKETRFLQRLFKTLILDHSVEMPFKNLYSTPKTLGVDRIALVAAAVDQFPEKHILIIDAGTCITYDFKNNQEEYLGGAISPGIRLRYESFT